jgi:hypothetical protein
LKPIEIRGFQVLWIEWDQNRIPGPVDRCGSCVL